MKKVFCLSLMGLGVLLMGCEREKIREEKRTEEIRNEDGTVRKETRTLQGTEKVDRDE